MELAIKIHTYPPIKCEDEKNTYLYRGFIITKNAGPDEHGNFLPYWGAVHYSKSSVDFVKGFLAVEVIHGINEFWENYRATLV